MNATFALFISLICVSAFFSSSTRGEPLPVFRDGGIQAGDLRHPSRLPAANAYPRKSSPGNVCPTIGQFD
jgi:hypothetical protein